MGLEKPEPDSVLGARTTLTSTLCCLKMRFSVRGSVDVVEPAGRYCSIHAMAICSADARRAGSRLTRPNR